MLGKDIKIVDCEKTSTFKEEEVLLINGIPITLEHKDRDAIKKALISGEVPSCDLLNQILYHAGILRHPVELETSLSVKSTMVTTEEVTVAKNGVIMDEKSIETQETNFYTSQCKEIWDPIGVIAADGVAASSASVQPDASLQSIGVYSSVTDDTDETDDGSHMKACEYSSREPLVSSPSPSVSYRHNPLTGKLSQSLSCDSGHDDVFNSNEQTNTYLSSKSSIPCDDLVSNSSMQGKPPMSPRCSRGRPQELMALGFGIPDSVPSVSFGQQTSRDSSKAAITAAQLEVDKENPDNTLIYLDGALVSAPMCDLIQHMVPTSDYYPDRSFLFAFLLSSRLFITPHDLFNRVCEISASQQDMDNTSNDPAVKNRAKQFALHFVRLLREWVDTFPYDFRDDRLMQPLRTVSTKCVALNSVVKADVDAMMVALENELSMLDRYEKYLQRIQSDEFDGSDLQTHAPLSKSSSATIQSALSTIDITELCGSSASLAHQLTHIELERLSHIGPEEFVQAFAKEVQLGDNVEDHKKTRNLESYVQWFNRLSYFVATEIVKHSKKKQRIRVIEYWIETARECFNIGNFNSLMAIIAGLNLAPISRLKKTWSKIQSDKFSVLEHQMDPSSNFNSYRSTLKAAMWRSAGATDERQRIVIPFFSLLVKDLYFLNEGCSNKLMEPSRLLNDSINFEKFWQLAKQISDFMAWKQVTCPYEKQERAIQVLQSNAVLNENTLAIASFECEQPENNYERERFKALKAEMQAAKGEKL